MINNLGAKFDSFIIGLDDMNDASNTGVYHGNSYEGTTKHNPFGYSMVFHFKTKNALSAIQFGIDYFDTSAPVRIRFSNSGGIWSDWKNITVS